MRQRDRDRIVNDHALIDATVYSKEANMSSNQEENESIKTEEEEDDDDDQSIAMIQEAQEFSKESNRKMSE